MLMVNDDGDDDDGDDDGDDDDDAMIREIPHSHWDPI